MPPAVEVFMRHLTEFLHSSNYQTGAQSSDDAAELEVTPSAEIHKDTDLTPFPSEPDLEGEFSRSGQHAGLAAVDPEQTEDCFSVSMESAAEMGQDNRQECNSGIAGDVETNDASRDSVSTDMDRTLLAESREDPKKFD